MKSVRSAKKYPRWIHGLPALIWAGLIAYGSLRPSREDSPQLFPHFDKLVHFCFYTIMTILLTYFLHKQYVTSTLRLKSATAAAGISWAYGCGMELLQHLLGTGRQFELADILANTLGCAVGFLVIIFYFYHQNGSLCNLN